MTVLAAIAHQKRPYAGSAGRAAAPPFETQGLAPLGLQSGTECHATPTPPERSDLSAAPGDWRLRGVVADWCRRSGIELGRPADIGHDSANMVVPFG